MQITPIKSDADYRAALAEIDQLMDAEDESPEGDRLDILATLVEAYEREHHPVEFPDPIAAIEFALEQRGLTRKDLVPVIGSRARVWEVMNRRRALSLEMIRGLHACLGVPAEVLIQPYRLDKAA